eukprot:GEMP01022086.1.p1 GENE.GEMP01022086.1~~GEMP01022086.1.p1  ORF type:complete len:555 (+),score=76.51 GEMP01022086.1:342-2006(+)
MKKDNAASLNSTSARVSRLRRGDYRIVAYHDKPLGGMLAPPTLSTPSSGRFERRAGSNTSYSSDSLHPLSAVDLRREFLGVTERSMTPTPDQKWPQSTKSSYRSFGPPHPLQHAASFHTSTVHDQMRATSYTSSVAHATKRSNQQRTSDRTGQILVPQCRSKKDDLEKETTRSQNSAGPIRCTLDLSVEDLETNPPLPRREVTNIPKVSDTANSDHESELCSEVFSRSGSASQSLFEEKDATPQRHHFYPWFPRDAPMPAKDLKRCEDGEAVRGQARYHDRDGLGSDLPKGKKVTKDGVSGVTVRKSDYLTTHELSEMFSLLDQFLIRASGFVEKAVPQAQFPDVLKSYATGSNRKKYADLLGRLNVMEKLFDFAEHKIGNTRHAKVEVATQTERTLISEKQTQPVPFQAPQHRPQEVRRSFGNQTATTAGFVEKPRAATRSYSAPRPWGTGFPLQGLRHNSLAGRGLLSHHPVSVWAQYSTLSTTQRSAGSAEQKIRDWLDTISIGNSKSRGWDDEQIIEIAEFAKRKQLDSLSAEQIYSKYVEFQVEEANKE